MTLERETILAYEIEELIKKLREGELDPLAVLEAYQARALEATEATNCVVDFMLEAREEAIALRRLHRDYRGPLYGVPISVKECFFVKGCDATAGLAKLINSPAQEDGCMIKVISLHKRRCFIDSSFILRESGRWERFLSVLPMCLKQ